MDTEVQKTAVVIISNRIFFTQAAINTDNGMGSSSGIPK